MSDIAARALEAHAAEEEARMLEKQADAVRNEARARRLIHEKASRLEIADVDISQMQSSGSSFRRAYTLDIPLTDDATLEIRAEDDRDGHPQAYARVRPCDQLYWNLPPGQEKKRPGGGVYGSCGLSGIDRRVESLADIGERLLRIETARKTWRRKHCRGDDD